VVLADGMGGQRHGALAAQAVIDTARRGLPGLIDEDPRSALTGFCHAANEAIREIGRRHGSRPGSTCTALYLRRQEAYWVHVGDSRLYHFTGNRLLYRTDDHTLGALLKGSESAGGARRAARARDNRLYMCLGGHNQLEPDFGATAIGRDDWFMLCSDGFWTQVQGEEAARSVAAAPADTGTADSLVALAAQRGGPRGDNVSLALAMPRRASARWGWWPF
jgi:serine/threonine protein phosphatase PrpC